MIIGEKILCKRSLYCYYNKGDYYHITYINDGYIFVSYDDDDFGYSTFHLTSDLKIRDDCRYIDYNIYRYDNYFMSLKEERMMKLKKLTNVDGMS